MDDSINQMQISVDLMAAQARLLALRGDASVKFQTQKEKVNSVNAIDLVKELPIHLGWHSQSFTNTARITHTRIETLLIEESASESPPPKHPQPSTRNTINLYPDLAIEILQDGSVPTARVWLLLRHFDKMGLGCMEEAEVRSYLCEPNSERRVCGWRQLRKLLTQGDGKYWQRQNGKIWLRSPIKVAKHFGLMQFTLKTIELPIELLCESVRKIRAHFYASFHSSRVKNGCSAPISRETLSSLTSLSLPTQRTYEKLAGISCQTNICISEISTPERKKQLSGEYGHALFEFTDHRGKTGKPGTTYLAWQLPNSYGGCHELSSKGHTKRLNRQLADLFGIGMTGNGKNRQDREAKRYFEDGAMASRQTKKGSEGFWRSDMKSKKLVLWHNVSI